MAGTTTLTIRLSQETKDKLDALAQSARRSRAFLVAEAVNEYVAENAWQIEAIGQVVAEAAAGGPFYGHEETMSYLERRARGENPARPQPIGIS
jgi:RHH-type transcriptional regulator, rel operon repressor / antitoxin RelB